MVQEYVFFSIHYPNILIAKIPSLPYTMQVYSILLSYETLEKHPCTPYFLPKTLHRVKVYSNEPHSGASFPRLIECTRWALRSTASSAMHIWGKELQVVLHQRLSQARLLCTDRLANPLQATSCPGDVMLFRVLCAVRTWLRNYWQLHYMLLLVQLFASSASSHCKHDMGTLSKERFVDFALPLSASSFARLQYSYNWTDQQVLWAFFLQQ